MKPFHVFTSVQQKFHSEFWRVFLLENIKIKKLKKNSNIKVDKGIKVFLSLKKPDLLSSKGIV